MTGAGRSAGASPAPDGIDPVPAALRQLSRGFPGDFKTDEKGGLCQKLTTCSVRLPGH